MKFFVKFGVLEPLLLSSYRTMVTLFTHKPVHIYKCYIVYLLISRISEVRVCVKWILCALLPWHAIYIYTINMYVRCWLLHSKHVRLRNISTPSSSAGCSFWCEMNSYAEEMQRKRKCWNGNQVTIDDWIVSAAAAGWIQLNWMVFFFRSLSREWSNMACVLYAQ